MLTKSDLYAVIREVINFKKYHNNTTDVTSHVENPNFDTILQFIREHADQIFIIRPDQQKSSVAPYINRIEHLFNLPVEACAEYQYCLSRNKKSHGKRI